MLLPGLSELTVSAVEAGRPGSRSIPRTEALTLIASARELHYGAVAFGLRCECVWVDRKIAIYPARLLVDAELAIGRRLYLTDHANRRKAMDDHALVDIGHMKGTTVGDAVRGLFHSIRAGTFRHAGMTRATAETLMTLREAGMVRWDGGRNRWAPGWDVNGGEVPK